jgi:hypothetical protein
MKKGSVAASRSVTTTAEHRPNRQGANIGGSRDMWGPSVEDQRSGDVVSYLHHLGAAHQEVQDSIAQGGVETQGV